MTGWSRRCLIDAVRNQTVILGLDPGLEGGIAILPGPILIRMPVEEIRSGKRLRHKILLGEFLRILDRYPVGLVVLETGGPRPKEGIVSAYTSGTNWGLLRGILAGRDLGVLEVAPTVWRRALCGHLETAKDKQTRKAQAIRRAQELYPRANLRPKPCRTDQSGLADALLLAHYGKGTLT